MDLAKTMYAPSQLASELDVRRQYSYFEKDQAIKNMLDAVNAVSIIINKERQIVLANKTTLNLLGLESTLSILGKRPGEIFECIHAHDHVGGCGTSESCRNCGAVNTILKIISSQERVAAETRIVQNINNQQEALDLLVSGNPYQIKGETLYVLTFSDISDTQRRTALERIFFHDIINISGGLSGIITLLKEDVPLSLQDELVFLEQCFKNMVEEILAQRQLLEAESNTLVVEENQLQVQELLLELRKIYHLHPVAEGKIIALSLPAGEINFTSDYTLLKRVLSNMLKNALEAAAYGEKVTVGCSLINADKKIKFWVHNNCQLTREVQLQMFQRSFSTKGKGRGLGSYSMKLLGERYLKGEVGFTSQEGEGTTFYLILSLQ